MDRQNEVGVRLILQVGGKKLKVAHFVTRPSDGSLYIIPFSRRGHYFGKIAHLGNGHGPFETQVDYSDAEASVDKGAPHISIHQSGLVRAQVTKGTFFGELQTPSMTLLVNQHIATLSMDSFESLPEHTGDVQKNDHVFQVQQEVKGLRFPIYVNSQHPAFLVPCLFHLKLERPSLARPLYYCVSFREDQIQLEGTPEDQATNHGITVIAGWDVSKLDAGEASQFLLLRGE